MSRRLHYRYRTIWIDKTSAVDGYDLYSYNDIKRRHFLPHLRVGSFIIFFVGEEANNCRRYIELQEGIDTLHLSLIVYTSRDFMKSLIRINKDGRVEQNNINLP